MRQSMVAAGRKVMLLMVVAGTIVGFVNAQTRPRLEPRPVPAPVDFPPPAIPYMFGLNMNFEREGLNGNLYQYYWFNPSFLYYLFLDDIPTLGLYRADLHLFPVTNALFGKHLTASNVFRPSILLVNYPAHRNWWICDLDSSSSIGDYLIEDIYDSAIKRVKEVLYSQPTPYLIWEFFNEPEAFYRWQPHWADLRWNNGWNSSSINIVHSYPKVAMVHAKAVRDVYSKPLKALTECAGSATAWQILPRPLILGGGWGNPQSSIIEEVLRYQFDLLSELEDWNSDIDRLIGKHLYEVVDGFSFHTYSPSLLPDFDQLYYNRMRRVVVRHAQRLMPLVMSERGYATERGLSCYIDADNNDGIRCRLNPPPINIYPAECMQANQLIRRYLTDMFNEARGSVFYCNVDKADPCQDGADACDSTRLDPEEFFGIFKVDTSSGNLIPKQAYLALRHFVQRLYGYEYFARIYHDWNGDGSYTMSDESVWCLVFRRWNASTNRYDYALVVWASGFAAPNNISLPTPLTGTLHYPNGGACNSSVPSYFRRWDPDSFVDDPSSPRSTVQLWSGTTLETTLEGPYIIHLTGVVPPWIRWRLTPGFTEAEARPDGTAKIVLRFTAGLPPGQYRLELQVARRQGTGSGYAQYFLTADEGGINQNIVFSFPCTRAEEVNLIRARLSIFDPLRRLWVPLPGERWVRVYLTNPIRLDLRPIESRVDRWILAEISHFPGPRDNSSLNCNLEYKVYQVNSDGSTGTLLSQSRGSISCENSREIRNQVAYVMIPTNDNSSSGYEVHVRLLSRSVPEEPEIASWKRRIYFLDKFNVNDVNWSQDSNTTAYDSDPWRPHTWQPTQPTLDCSSNSTRCNFNVQYKKNGNDVTVPFYPYSFPWNWNSSTTDSPNWQLYEAGMWRYLEQSSGSNNCTVDSIPIGSNHVDYYRMDLWISFFNSNYTIDAIAHNYPSKEADEAARNTQHVNSYNYRPLSRTRPGWRFISDIIFPAYFAIAWKVPDSDDALSPTSLSVRIGGTLPSCDGQSRYNLQIGTGGVIYIPLEDAWY
ncbi:hypothetical protein HRbin15_00384 [bacterium HR15]|nr:hypothetical protein HRbin15_00384 [bacterium HR15]